MSRSRRRRRGSGGGNANQPKQQPQQRRGGKPQQKKGHGNGKQHGAAFWGDPERLPEPTDGLRIVDEPDAVVRSLGMPPLRNHEVVSGHYFAAVYDQAVKLAGALATAAGLIDVDELRSELAEDD